MTYFLASDYRERLEPEYFHDEDMDAVWQPDVYPDAASLARMLGSRKIVDLGCGDGSKLVAMHPEFDVVGVDFGANIERARELHSDGAWVELDLDSDEPLPFDEFDGALLVCSDVLEHLRFPEKALRRAREALARGADALVLSTPDRDRAEGEGHLGPPRNPSHVREWNGDELRLFLDSCGLAGFFGVTRSNDYLDELHTTFVVVPGLGAGRRKAVETWFNAREPWERRSAEHAAKLAAERARVEEFSAAVSWCQSELAGQEEQLAAHKAERERLAGLVDAAQRRIAELEAIWEGRPIPLSHRIRAAGRALFGNARSPFRRRNREI